MSGFGVRSPPWPSPKSFNRSDGRSEVAADFIAALPNAMVPYSKYRNIGIFRFPHKSWQKSNIDAGAQVPGYQVS